MLALAPARPGIVLLRVLTIGVYFHSALSKIDDLFLHGVGQDFLRALLGVAGVL